MKVLSEERQSTQKKICEQKQNYVDKGLQYYDEEKRRVLFERAKSQHYSMDTLARLQELKGEKWNQDNVDYNVIKDVKKVETFVGKNLARWEKSPLTAIGGLINGRK